MRLYLKFITVRAARHVSKDRQGVSASLYLVPLDHDDPRHDQVTRVSAREAWPNGAGGELSLGYLAPGLLQALDAGVVVDVTLEVPDAPQNQR